MSDDVLLVTVEDPQIYEVFEWGPMLQSNRFVGINFIRDFFATMRGFWGGRSRGYERAIDTARSGALDELEALAWKGRYNAVLGVRMDTSLSNWSVLATAEGTAARIRPRRDVVSEDVSTIRTLLEGHEASRRSTDIRN